ncbi:uncharacterized protein PRCAT00001308001 [Priceomyces carsonii]|uniref:uncharacterized protein n=1 Tax=Priceomyces carsonii TaxID=28549 RepID=UPI002EDA711C|nr:unnamed protein product [Priceomyces carsonii]
MDEKSYLEDGFDPKSLKVASLRGILNEHKVLFPSNAKKQDLINIFNSNIKPQAKLLLDSYKDSIGNSNGEGFENIVTKEETKPKSRARSKTPKQKTPTPVSSSVSPKEESSSSFTNDNVFQSSQGTSERHKKSRKRSHPEEKGTPTNKKKVKAKSTDNEKSIFDDSSDYSEIGNSFLEATTARRSKTPEKYSETTVGKKLKSDSKIKTSPKIHGSSPSAAHLSNEDTVVQNMDLKTKISSVKTPQSKVPSQKNTPKKKDATPKRTPKRTPVKSPKSNSVKKSAKEEGVETNKFDKYTSLEKEASNYDRQLKMIKEKESNKLASDLGIKIQGLPSQNFVLNKDTIELPKKKAAGPLLESSLKPRRRIIPEPTLDSLEASDDDKDLGSESEVEEDHRASSFEDNLNKIKTNLRADFAKINRSISGRKTSSGIVFGFIFLWFILISAGLFGYWYREQTIMIGYCGEEIDVPTFSKSEGMPSLLVSMGDYLDANFKPSCKPCPPHARCFPYLEIGCYEDFMEAKPWFAMINPSLKTCVPDTRKAEKLETMIDVALDMLRSKNAQRNCGTAPKEDLEAGISVDTLHDLLFLIKAPYITTEEFEDLWNRSVVELQKEPEIIVRQVLNFSFTNEIFIFKMKQFTNNSSRQDTGLITYLPLELTLTTLTKKQKTRFFDRYPYQTSL